MFIYGGFWSAQKAWSCNPVVVIQGLCLGKYKPMGDRLNFAITFVNGKVKYGILPPVMFTVS